MTYKIAAAILAFLVARLQASARAAANGAVQLDRDIVSVEASRAARVKLANDQAAKVTAELAAQRQELGCSASKAAALAANLRLLTSLEPSTVLMENDHA